jgi:hypothetical protein
MWVRGPVDRSHPRPKLTHDRRRIVPIGRLRVGPGRLLHHPSGDALQSSHGRLRRLAMTMRSRPVVRRSRLLMGRLLMGRLHRPPRRRRTLWCGGSRRRGLLGGGDNGLLAIVSDCVYVLQARRAPSGGAVELRDPLAVAGKDHASQRGKVLRRPQTPGPALPRSGSGSAPTSVALPERLWGNRAR